MAIRLGVTSIGCDIVRTVGFNISLEFLSSSRRIFFKDSNSLRYIFYGLVQIVLVLGKLRQFNYVCRKLDEGVIAWISALLFMSPNGITPFIRSLSFGIYCPSM